MNAYVPSCTLHMHFPALHIVQETPISITLGPVDTNAMEAEEVLCDCRYTGTKDLPMWRINGTLHSPSFLPPGYTANKSGLYFQAGQDLHLSNYQCLFNVYNAVTENIEMTESCIGTLFVTPGQCICKHF